MSGVLAVHNRIRLRLFGKRSIAINFANQMTSLQHVQYYAKPIKGSGGHVIVKAGGKVMYDHAGLLPDRIVSELINKGVYLEWRNPT